MEIGEKSFPRGGKKPALRKNKNTSFSLFKKPKAKFKNKKKKITQAEKKKVATSTTQTKQVHERLDITNVEDLSGSAVQEGMLILGVVSQVTDKRVCVSLPGGLRGVINLPNVSEFYKNMIETSTSYSQVPYLKELFQPGDVLPVKVISVSETHNSLILTSDPQLINFKLSYNVIEEGFILVGSVKSAEDHGFIIDFGIQNVNAFLKFEKVDIDRNLKVGQLVRCCVIDCKTSAGLCSAQLSTLKEDIEKSIIKKSVSIPIFSFIPGFQYNIVFKKQLQNGLEVSYGSGNNTRGFIYEDHLMKKFPNVTEVTIGKETIATLLYVKPLVNFAYFKVMPKKPPELPFEYGAIVKGKVWKARRGGVIAKITEGSVNAKCFIPVSKLKNYQKLLEDKSKLFSLYTANKILPKIRLGNFDYMGRLYIGAIDRASIDEKYFSLSDLKCGEIVSCIILEFGNSTVKLKIGKTITGIVRHMDLHDLPLKSPTANLKVGQKVQARIMEIVPETHFVRLTMKPSILKEKKILCSYEDAEINKTYLGTVSRVFANKIIVLFFNGVSGVVPKRFTPYLDSTSLANNFSKGQLVKCTVVSANSQNLVLSLLLNKPDLELEVGKQYRVKVVNKTESGLIVDVHINKTKCQGYIPATLLTSHIGLTSVFHSTSSPEDKFFAYCISNDATRGLPILGVLECLSEFYKNKAEDLEKMFEVGSVLPFLFKSSNSSTNSLFLQNLIPVKEKRFVEIVKHDFPSKDFKGLSKYQLIYGQILRIKGNKIYVSVALSDVWDKNFHGSLNLLDSYLKLVHTLIERQKDRINAYTKNISLGYNVKGVIEEVRSKCAVVRTMDGDLGIAEGQFFEGQEINGKVIWVDVSQQIIYIRAKPITEDEEPKNEITDYPLVPENDNLRGKVVFINEEVIVVELKGRGNGTLAFLPRKRHWNDFEIKECVYSVGEELKVWVTRKDSKYLLAMDRRVIAMQEKLIWKQSENKLKQSEKSLKRKLESKTEGEAKKIFKNSESSIGEDEVKVVDVKLRPKNCNGNSESVEGFNDEPLEIKEEIDEDENSFSRNNNSIQTVYDDVEVKSENETEDDDENTPCNNIKSQKIKNDEKILLSSSSESEDDDENCNDKNVNNSNLFKVDFNWEVLNNNSLLSGVVFNKKEESSDDEDDESKNEKKKQRRLTANEKREKAKSEEERLRFIEERLMDANREPETADDFDRAVLANPNSSELWLKYMAFHVQGTEIEKARAVARRALKAISFRKEQEKLNIWIALLNLENIYGNEDFLSKTLNEALQANEPYKIHFHMLTIYGQSNKLQEMEKLGNFMLKKYKDLENMWPDVGCAYFSVGKLESARNVLQKALTVMDKSRHIILISKFAQMENKYGSQERAQTLYESILSSFPKRVDVWSCYVDMLVKSNHIDLARQVLERATSQSLRPRKMKTLFKKFLTFEETYGTPETVEKVRQAAVDYVQTVGALND